MEVASGSYITTPGRYLLGRLRAEGLHDVGLNRRSVASPTLSRAGAARADRVAAGDRARGHRPRRRRPDPEAAVVFRIVRKSRELIGTVRGAARRTRAPRHAPRRAGRVPARAAEHADATVTHARRRRRRSTRSTVSGLPDDITRELTGVIRRGGGAARHETGRRHQRGRVRGALERHQAGPDIIE
jgi:hypothetical protein